MSAERHGLRGTACFDARWPEPVDQVVDSAYRLYDVSLHRAAELARPFFTLRLDSEEHLFEKNSCSDAALYCGWYSLGTYVDAFTWVKGAIGYHMASAECSTLKSKTSQVWCKELLKDGVAATLGPVYEPYIQGFPLPEVFFGAMLKETVSLGEAYLVSQPYLSWQMMLIGDPLYRPFKTGFRHSPRNDFRQ